MIPKKIHFCWYGNKPYPDLISNCLNSWEKWLDSYELIKWDESNTQFDNPWLNRALEQKKYAFIADYVRFRALYDQGGIYLDTDMLVLKPLDGLLDYHCFMGFEDDIHINTAIVGCEPGHPLIKKILDSYRVFFDQNDFKVVTSIITPIVKGYLGSLNPKIINDKNGLTVFPADYFYPLPYSESENHQILHEYLSQNSFTAHLWFKSWYDEFSYFSIQEFKKGFKLVFRKLKSNPFQPLSYYKFLAYSLFINLKKELLPKD